MALASASASASAFLLASAEILVISAFSFALASAHDLALSAASDFACSQAAEATLSIYDHRRLRFIFYLRPPLRQHLLGVCLHQRNGWFAAGFFHSWLNIFKGFSRPLTNGRFGFAHNLCRVYVRHTEVLSEPLPLTSRNFLRILPLPCIHQVN